jgi:hypothetical protein
MKTPWLLSLLALTPTLVAGQGDSLRWPTGRLTPDVASDLMTIVRQLDREGLPGAIVADIARHGAALDRPSAEVLFVAREFASTLREARAAITRAARPATPEEIRAAALAMNAGLDAAAVSDLARAAPPGRSLVVALLVTSSLMQGGLAAEEAVGVVRDRLVARVPDADLMVLPELLTGIRTVDVPFSEWARGFPGLGLGRGAGGGVSSAGWPPFGIPSPPAGRGKRATGLPFPPPRPSMR